MQKAARKKDPHGWLNPIDDTAEKAAENKLRTEAASVSAHSISLKKGIRMPIRKANTSGRCVNTRIFSMMQRIVNAYVPAAAEK